MSQPTIWPKGVASYVDPSRPMRVQLGTSRLGLQRLACLVVGGGLLVAALVVAVVSGPAPGVVLGAMALPALWRFVMLSGGWFTLELREDDWIVRSGRLHQTWGVTRLPVAGSYARVGQGEVVIEVLDGERDRPVRAITLGDRVEIENATLGGLADVINTQRALRELRQRYAV